MDAYPEQALEARTRRAYNGDNESGRAGGRERRMTMKKQIGTTLALYPTPLTVIGAMVDGKPNWALVGHVGIIGHDRLLISMAAAHRTNEGIREGGVLSVNLVDEALLPKADHAGCVSGKREDKSGLFAWHAAENGAPLIDESPVSMACTVVDTYRTPGFESFICRIDGTWADEQVLNDAGRIDYRALKPVLFEMPTYEYIASGDVIGWCMHLKDEKK